MMRSLQTGLQYTGNIVISDVPVNLWIQVQLFVVGH